MAKLYFRYGAMGSSKTANALMVRYNYIEKGQKVILLKPSIENRDGYNIIKSRIGLSAECELVEDLLEKIKQMEKSGDGWNDADVIIIDEAQFLNTEQINELARIVDDYHISVICYGLRTDFTSHLFEGAKRLMELADVIEEIPTICWCGKKAQFNARVKDGKIVRNGAQIEMGGNESYVSLCRKHYMSGKIHA
ncbi:thymidine kinase [Enterocloster aldenensis]|uniref:thymidine kinase n=1 Tax=Enterocloster aldenensis TaxID=358742 RepID=UPI000E4DC715|nr:thymidine kinase [Enterocloster aldenensis]